MRILVFVSIVGIAMLLSIPGEAFAQGTTTQTPVVKPSMVIGFSLPSFGGARYGSQGYIKSMFGGNILLGISYRSYTGIGLRPGRFNFYWGIGTLLLLLPYWEFGFTYPLSLANGEQLLNLDIGVLYILPYLGISLVF